MNTPYTEWRGQLKTRFLGRSVIQTIDELELFIESLLTSRDTYWKERVRKEIDICEDVLKGSAGSKSEIEGAFWHLRNNLLTK